MGRNVAKPYVGYVKIDGDRHYLGRFPTKAEREAAQDRHADAFCLDRDKCRHRNHVNSHSDSARRHRSLRDRRNEAA